MTINSVCKQYSYVIEKRTTLLTHAEEQGRTKNLNQVLILLVSFLLLSLKKFSIEFLIKKKISDLLGRSNM